MMQEILTGGPITASIEAPDEVSLANNIAFKISSVSSITLDQRDIEFEFTNHSIVIIGWGYDPFTSTKYWL